MKKLIAIAAAALLSANASAGYVRYDFQGPVSGFIIQHDTDQSIAHFRLFFPLEDFEQPFNMQLDPQGADGYTRITEATTYFRNNGPTNFKISSNYGGDQFTGAEVTFSRDKGGNFAYVLDYSSSVYFSDGYRDTAGTHEGIVTQGFVPPNIEEDMDFRGGYHVYVNKIVPTYIGPGKIPEPGSFALLAIGALGVAGLRRRKPQ